MPAVLKFSYLKSVLKRSALSAIAEIPLTSENYSLVVKLLQERFGWKEAIIDSLCFKLQSESCNKFADNSTGEWDNWESPKTAGSSGWIQWRTLYVTVQENGQRYVSSVNTNVKGQHFLPRQLTSDSHRPSTEVLTANSEIVNKKAKLRHHYLVLSVKVTILMMCDKFTIFKNNRKAELKRRDKSCFILCLK